MSDSTSKGMMTGDSNLDARRITLGKQYLINRPGGQSGIATALNTRTTKKGQTEVYIAVAGTDKRLDTWIPESELGGEVSNTSSAPNGQSGPSKSSNGLKRKQLETLDINGFDGTPEPTISEPSTPEREHANATRVRNVEDVRFGEYLINTWYYSPYPLSTEGPTNGSSTALDKPGPSSYAHTNGMDAKPSLSRSASKKGKAPMPNGEVNGQDVRARMARTTTEVFGLGVGRGGEGARPRLWICDLCFKYMKTRDGWERHTSGCTVLQPPGRKVYQRGSYTIWEVDGAVAPLYCQNLSLFGKLFIDHKSVFYHVEGFLFYVLCDAATSRRDQVMAFFSKEKQSYDDFNLACIITFPPFQNNGFGKLLIEFSYIVTKHPSTRSITGSPGTPERPLSDLGLKGYMAYWTAVILRFCRALVGSAPPLDMPPPPIPETSSKSTAPRSDRSLRERRSSNVSNGMKDPDKPTIKVDGQNFRKRKEAAHPGQYGVSVTLAEIARACHIRIDDVAFTLAELGFLQHRRPVHTGSTKARRKRKSVPDDSTAGDSGETGDGAEDDEDLSEWKDVEVVISREMVDEAWKAWRVKDQGVLDESYVLL